MRRFIYFFLALLLSACGAGERAPALDKGELIVLTRQGPLTYMERDAVSGESAGFEHDLVNLFAQELGLKARFVLTPSDVAIEEKLRKGAAHMAAAWLSPAQDGPLKNSPSYFQGQGLLVSHEASLPLRSIEQLAGKTVHVQAGSRHTVALQEIRKQVPTLTVIEESERGELELLEGVATQNFDAVLVDQAVFDIGGNYHPELQGSLEIGKKTPIVWLFNAESAEMPLPDSGNAKLTLREKATDFLARVQRDGTIAQLKDRYFGHVERLRQADIVHFLERVRTVLPQYRPMFQAAQASTGIDWRLLAALAYQESQWDPLATSPTGVRGMMMLTADTADHLGVTNRLDARMSIRAGSRYLGELQDALPASIKAPDRLWLALAAYNLGMGHLNGARSIAQSLKANPDSWFEMKRVLPLLVRPEYYNRLKSGKARGGEAVIMVENIRVFTDILTRYEAPHLAPVKPARSKPAKKPGNKPKVKVKQAES